MTAEELREGRRKRKLTQKELADLCMVNIRTVQKWEGGERHMSKWSDYDVKKVFKEIDNDKSIKDPT